jgi:hypothetical protein
VRTSTLPKADVFNPIRISDCEALSTICAICTGPGLTFAAACIAGFGVVSPLGAAGESLSADFAEAGSAVCSAVARIAGSVREMIEGEEETAGRLMSATVAAARASLCCEESCCDESVVALDALVFDFADAVDAFDEVADCVAEEFDDDEFPLTEFWPKVLFSEDVVAGLDKEFVEFSECGVCGKVLKRGRLESCSAETRESALLAAVWTAGANVELPEESAAEEEPVGSFDFAALTTVLPATG